MWDMVDDRLGVPLDQRRDWTTGFQHYYEKAEAGMNQSIAKYYPDRPASPLPMALPVEAYSGTYFHPGYLNFTVQLAGDMDKKHILRDNITLAAIRADATWPSMNLFEHVSGEYWMMYQYYLGSPQGPTQEYAPAQFEIGPDGRVARMGITWLAVSPGKEDTVEGLVWFDKID
ncbi:hypothetical protein BD289DRAFT_456821 [Coniella lustricola]|uniref:Peptidase S12 Pab87-related C-terminal domain-containing protein n=1 Tax=Coniella lustricola TaxID=2025994 RepID=A0A2T2ZUF0_9PEZI|nr:hypothetical protein BD289DRAFT_456821 [Coniella lustricola]